VLVEVPEHPPVRSAETRPTLLAEGAVHINGDPEPLVDAPTPQHAEFLVAAITADAELSGPIVLPADPEEAENHAREWRAAWRNWLKQANAVLEDLMPGGQRVRRRRQVLVALLELHRAAPEEGIAEGTD
jgi:hypothetical protein